jgi:hypothetical protein
MTMQKVDSGVVVSPEPWDLAAATADFLLQLYYWYFCSHNFLVLGVN